MTIYPSNIDYSFSKINSFYSCPHGFYRKYFEREKGIGSEVADFGSFVHLILEKYAKNELKIDELLQYYIDNYDKHVKGDIILNFSGFKKNLTKSYYQDGYNYFKSFQGFEGYKILGAEINFSEQMENGFIFDGQIDLLLEDKDGNLILCDHKSKKNFQSKKEKKEYTRQLYLYAYHITKKYGKPPKQLVFNMFRNEGFVVQDFNIDDYNEALGWFERCIEDIENEISFDAQPDTFYCLNFCSFRNKKDNYCINEKG